MKLIAQVGRGGATGYAGDSRTDFRRDLNTINLAERLEEGGWVIVHPKANSATVVASPIPADEASKCPAPSEALLSGLEGSFKQMAQKDFEGLDKVTYEDYADWWRARGAAVGKWDGEKINWQTLGEYEDVLDQ